MPNEMSFSDAVDSLTNLFDDSPEVAEDAVREDPEEPEESLDAPDPEEKPGDEEAEGEVDEDEPAGHKYLHILGADGKAHRMHIDKLLAGTVHAVKEDGKVRHVPYDELISGYQRQSDYTRKTQATAEREAALAPFSDLVAYAKGDPAFIEYIQGYFATGGVPPYLMQQAMPEVTEAQLAMALEKGDEDLRKQAAAVLRARDQVRTIQRQHMTRKEAIQQERAQLLKAKRETETRKIKAHVADYDEQAKSIQDSLRQYGYTDAELEDVDSRVLRMAYDALQHQRRVKAGADKRNAPAPRVPKQNSRSGASETSRQAKRVASHLARAKQTDNLSDWANVLEGLF